MTAQTPTEPTSQKHDPGQPGRNDMKTDPRPLIPAQRNSQAFPPSLDLPLPAQLYFALGQALHLEGLRQTDPDQANQRLNLAVQSYLDAWREHTESGTDPRQASILWVYIAQAREAQNRAREAFQAYIDAVLASPELAHQVIPLTHRLLNSEIARVFQDKETQFQELVSRSDLEAEDRAMIANLLGRIYLLRQDYSRAKSIFETALGENPNSIYVHQGLAQAYWHLNERNGAIEISKKTLPLAKQRGEPRLLAQVYLDMARYFLEDHQYEAAYQAAELGMSTSDTNYPDFLIIMGQSALGKQACEEAERLTSQALEMLDSADRQRAAALAIRAECAYRRHEYDQADQLALLALDVDDSYIPAIITRGKALIAAIQSPDEVQTGIRLLRYVLDREMLDLETLQTLLNAMQASDAPDQDQVSVIERMLHIAPPLEQAQLHLRMAELLFNLNRNAMAQKHLNMAISHDRSLQDEAWWYLNGQILDQLGNEKEALKSYKKAYEKAPDNPLLKKAYASLLQVRGRLRDAAQLWQELIEENPEDWEAYIELAWTRLKMGDATRAIELADKVLDAALTEDIDLEAVNAKAEALIAQEASGEEMAEFYYEHGNRYKNQEHYSTANTLYEHGATYNPNHAPLHWQWIESLRMASYYVSDQEQDKVLIRQALELWNRVTQEILPDEDHSWVYLTRALINFKSDLLPIVPRMWEIILYVEKALAIDPQDAYRWTTMGWAYRNLDGQINARLANQQALAVDPEYRWGLEEQIIITSNLGEFDEALRLLELYRKDEDDLWSRGVLGTIMLQKGYDDPLYLDKALDYFSAESDDLYYRSMRAAVLYQKGELELARQEYRGIWQDYDPQRTDDQIHFANAAFNLGIYDDDPQMIERAEFLYLKSSSQPYHRVWSYLYLVLCTLYRVKQMTGKDIYAGMAKAESYLDQAIEFSMDRRLMLEFKKTDFKAYFERYPYPPTELAVEEWESFIAGMGTRLDEKIEALAHLPTPEAEIRFLLDNLPQKELSESEWEIIRQASQAALARLRAG
jgi:tetratricopeptide (TPR) repeat protein